MLQLFLVSVVLTSLLYGYSLFLPFFFDDLDHIPFAINTPYWDLFADSGGFPYFRPIGVASHRLIVQLFGEQNAIAQHAANLLIHSMNGGLVGLLVAGYHNQKRRWQPYLATLFFVVFPFSYQAVPWIDARYHLLALTFLLAATLASSNYVNSGSRRWLFIASVACLIAPLTHENGNAAAILPICYLILQTSRNWTRIVPVILTTLSSGAAGFWLWRRAAPATDGLEINQLETIYQNSAYFMQGLGWPIAWPGGWLIRQGVNDLAIALVVGAVTILAAIWIGRQTNSVSRVLFALLWCAAGSLLTILFLGFTYVIDGPRLLYVAAAGVALLWGGLVDDGYHYYRKPGQRGLIVLITLLGLGSAGVFHLRSYQLYQLAGSGFDAAIHAVEQSDAANHEVSVVNLADWFAHPDPYYAVGHEGVMFLPDYIAKRRLVDVSASVDVAPEFVRFDDTISDVPLVFGVSGEARAWAEAEAPHDVYLMQYSAETYTATAQPVGVAGLPRDLQAAAVRFEGDGVIWLDSAEITQENDALRVSLTWHVEEAPSQPIAVFVHGISADGALVTQSDGRPFGDMYPFETWPGATTGTDIRYLSTDAVELRIGLYESISGTRWNAIGTDVIEGENSLQIFIVER